MGWLGTDTHGVADGAQSTLFLKFALGVVVPGVYASISFTASDIRYEFGPRSVGVHERKLQAMQFGCLCLRLLSCSQIFCLWIYSKRDVHSGYTRYMCTQRKRQENGGGVHDADAQCCTCACHALSSS